MSNVIYLSAWLDCPDDILRRNFALQERINGKRIRFWQVAHEKGISDFQAQATYMMFIQKNRKKLKLVPTESDQAS